jgi:succinyl-CoA synthetase beta subunit/citryl-CoA synthetase large subunit
MAALLEDKTKLLLSRRGLAVPTGVALRAGEELATAMSALSFPVVVKALIPIGKKGKAGAVRMAANAAELAQTVDAILGHTFRGFLAEAVLIESCEQIVDELFLTITFDSRQRGAIMVLGRQGGVDVEEAALTHPEAFARLPVDLAVDPTPGSFTVHWQQLGLSAEQAISAGAATEQALNTFRQCDARVLEINPLGLTLDGRCLAIGTLMDIDDDALYRQPEVSQWAEYGSSRMGRPATPLERRLLDLDAKSQSGSVRFMELAGGDIACLLSGGGCSLWSTDHVIDQGGKPATYYDATTPSEEILRTLIEGVVSLPGVRGLVFGSNIINFTRIDARVKLVIDILETLGLDLQRFPVVMRMAGAGEDEAREAAARLPYLEYYGADVTLEFALDRIVERVKDVQSRSPAA